MAEEESKKEFLESKRKLSRGYVMKTKIGIYDFIKDKITYFREHRSFYGCATHKLDDWFAVAIGWSEGYGDEEHEGIIQAEENYNWALNVGVKIWGNNSMLTDYDYLDFPSEPDGDIMFTGLTVEKKDTENEWEDYYRQLTTELYNYYVAAKDAEARKAELIAEGKLDD